MGSTTEVVGVRILLAEDEKALSKAIVKIFEKNNYSADAVYNGEDALSYLEMGCYDVAVLGGLIGLLMSFLGIRIYDAVASSAIGINWPVALAAILFCTVIGILFGSYPAAKASKLQPIDALRAE